MLARWGALAAATLLSAALGSCGGAHSSPAALLPSASAGAAAGLGTASFTVVVPPAGSAGATPQSIAIALVGVNGAPAPAAAPFTMNLSSATPACIAVAGGAMSCTATVSAPLGNDTFALTTYAGSNESGPQLATSQAQATITGVGKTACVRVSNGTPPSVGI